MSGHERERLSAYLDRELPPDERAAVEAHLAACPECAAFLGELSAVDEAAAALPAEAPDGYFEAFPARVRSRLKARRVATPARRLPAWAWAAAAALLLAVVTPLTLRRPRPVPAEVPVPGAALPAPAKAEPPGALDFGLTRPAPTARPAQRLPVEIQEPPRAAAPATVPAQENAPVVAPPPREAKPHAPKDQLSAGTFAREPDAAAPAVGGVAAPATLADAESAAVEGGVSSQAVTSREKGVPKGQRPAAAEATPEAVSPALSPVIWRRVRDDWNAFAAAQTDPVRADEARVRAIEAAREAWRAGGDESDQRAFRRAAEDYLRREDARQKPRVARLLTAP